MNKPYVMFFEALGREDVHLVGGKNSSLGEMIQNLSQLGVKVPPGFATTAQAYRDFLSDNGLDKRLKDLLQDLDVENLAQLAEKGAKARQWIIDAPFSSKFIEEMQHAYQTLRDRLGKDFTVAVRSSATAEDLPEASFAGQQETFLNVHGFEEVLQKIKLVFASLYTDRAIAYRNHHGFAHEDVALSAGIQKMVRSDEAAAGVMFTLDTETGSNEIIFITSNYGLGELLVQGSINPDEFYVYKSGLKKGFDAILSRRLGQKQQRMVYNTAGSAERVKIESVPEELRLKFSLTDAEITQLAQFALTIEAHYGCPMDIEWAKDGAQGELYIVQARPETVKSRQDQQTLERFNLLEQGEILSIGRSIGQKIGQGRARVIKGLADIDKVEVGDVLITDMTDPDWEPVMKRAAAIVTNRGGRTCHAAIIARELGIPAVVGCNTATKDIQDGTAVTVSCAEGEDGKVYAGLLKFERKELHIDAMPKLPFKICMNVGTPDRAFDFCQLPNFGVGLARLEFIINRAIGIHPNALLNFDRLAPELKQEIQHRTLAYPSPVDYYVMRLAEGIATLGAAFYPKPVIVRLSDFKSNEYANLLGGDTYEPHEENPMLGFRGASRYAAPSFKDCFALECRAVKYVREKMGLTNVEVMIPFVRTVAEAKAVIEVLAAHGLKRGENGLRLIMMCEIPSNALLADQFLEYFDGFSIGSNDLTQLTLGLDRDSGLVAQAFDERNEAVKMLLQLAIDACRKQGKYIGICGQGPSDHPDLALWLMEQGIDAISLNPDTVVSTWLFLGEAAK